MSKYKKGKDVLKQRTLPFEKIKELKDDKIKYLHYDKRILALREYVTKYKNLNQRIQYAREIMACQDEQKQIMERALKLSKLKQKLGEGDEVS